MFIVAFMTSQGMFEPPSEPTFVSNENLTIVCGFWPYKVMRVGCAGWWYVRVVDQALEGWVPASYLGAVTTTGTTGMGSTTCRTAINTRSSPSISSQGTQMNIPPPSDTVVISKKR